MTTRMADSRQNKVTKLLGVATFEALFFPHFRHLIIILQFAVKHLNILKHDSAFLQRDRLSVDRLTERELEVLHLVSKGLTNPQIGVNRRYSQVASPPDLHEA